MEEAVKSKSLKKYAQYVEMAIFLEKMENATSKSQDVLNTLMENVNSAKIIYILIKIIIVNKRSQDVYMIMEFVLAVLSPLVTKTIGALSKAVKDTQVMAVKNVDLLTF